MMNLSQTITKAIRAIEASAIAAYYDARLDGGEFSGPAHSRALEKKLNDIAKDGGFATYDDFCEQATRRTTKRWVYQHLEISAYDVRVATGLIVHDEHEKV